MNDKERLNEIIIRYKTVKPFEFYNDIGVIAMDEKDKDWPIEQAKKAVISEDYQTNNEQLKREFKNFFGSVEVIKAKQIEVDRKIKDFTKRVYRAFPWVFL